MDYLGIIILFIILSLCYVIARSIAFTTRNIEKSKNSFIAREAKANSTRRQDISQLKYIEIDMGKIPVDTAKAVGCTKIIEELEALCHKKILNLSMYSNTDLKLMYGPANLEELSICDNNFTELIRLLNTLAKELINEPNNAEATITLLEYAVEIGSDITATYVMLGQLYRDKGDSEKLNRLIKNARKITSLSGKTIVSRLTQIKQN